MELQITILIKIILAMALGGIIGFNREKANKAAGLRTHICVAGASAFFVSVTSSLIAYIKLDAVTALIQSDPIRVMEATITGVAFLGAGTIIKGRRDNISGLTTAASLLLTAATGLAVAIELYVVAIGVTFSTWIVLSVIARFEHKGSSS